MERMKEFSVAGIDQVPNTADPDYYKFILDRSRSMCDKTSVVRTCLNNYQNELLNIDEASSIAISRANFDEGYTETPYQSVENFSTNYSSSYGGTDLYGAIVKSVNSTIKSQEKLIEEAYEPRMTNILLTDGNHEHYCSGFDFNDAKEAVKEAISHGITMVFVDFGGKNGDIPRKLGFQSIYSCDNSIDALSDAFKKITTSCIRQSQSKIVDPENWLAD